MSQNDPMRRGRKPNTERQVNISVRVPRKILYAMEKMAGQLPLSVLLRALLDAQLCRHWKVESWIDLPEPPDGWEPKHGTR